MATVWLARARLTLQIEREKNERALAQGLNTTTHTASHSNLDSVQSMDLLATPGNNAKR